MANYIIEGIVSEFSFDENFFRLKGCEGYSVIQDKKIYNILCPEKMPEKEDSKNCCIFSQDFKFPVDKCNTDLLKHAIVNGRKIRLCLNLPLEKFSSVIDLEGLKKK